MRQELDAPKHGCRPRFRRRRQAAAQERAGGKSTRSSYHRPRKAQAGAGSPAHGRRGKRAAGCGGSGDDGAVHPLSAAGLARRGDRRGRRPEEEQQAARGEREERERNGPRGGSARGAEVYEGEFARFGGLFWKSVAFGWDLESTTSKTGVSGQWDAGTTGVSEKE